MIQCQGLEEVRIIEYRNESAPWNDNPWRLISLLDMLKFSADRFHVLSSTLMKVILFPDIPYNQEGLNEIAQVLLDIRQMCVAFGLRLSANKAQQAITILHEGHASPETLTPMLTELHSRLYEELGTEMFFYVPRDKAGFAEPGYFSDPEIERAFPSTIPEFERAGRCFAYDEPTACVFHLMRVLDYGLKSLAVNLGTTYDSQSWQTVGNYIETRMREKYQTKTEEWKKSEPLYAEALTDIQAIGKSHRNPSLHRIDKTYDDREAYHLITIVEGFMRHLAKGGLSEKKPVLQSRGDDPLGRVFSRNPTT